MTHSLIPLPTSTVTAIDYALEHDSRLKSMHTTRQYRSHLTQFEAWRQGRTLTKTLVEEYAAHLQRQGYKPATINQRITIIRWWTAKVIDLAKDQGGADPEEIEKAARVLTVRNVDTEGGSESIGRHLDVAEFRSLLAACDTDPSPSGRRDKAILWVAWSNGLRRQTLCDLLLSNLETTETGARIKYVSKRRKRGTVHLLGEAWAAMCDWLAVRGRDPGPIFTPILKNGKVIIPEKPLNGESIRLWLDTRVLQAGFGKHMTWHTFRYTFAGTLLDEGYDISTVQALMLHATPTQTSRYDKRKERHQEEAIATLSSLGGNHGQTIK